jgi:hypothetical protein
MAKNRRQDEFAAGRTAGDSAGEGRILRFHIALEEIGKGRCFPKGKESQKMKLRKVAFAFVVAASITVVSYPSSAPRQSFNHHPGRAELSVA